MLQNTVYSPTKSSTHHEEAVTSPDKADASSPFPKSSSTQYLYFRICLEEPVLPGRLANIPAAAARDSVCTSGFIGGVGMVPVLEQEIPIRVPSPRRRRAEREAYFRTLTSPDQKELPPCIPAAALFV